MRLFVAVDLPASLRRALGDVAGRLRDGLPGARWVRPEGVHLTLRFVGEAAENRIASLRGALAAAVPGATEPFEVKVGAGGVFPGRARPRVLWLGVEGDERLVRLQNVVEEAVVRAGFLSEARPFRPHLTLARFTGRISPGRVDSALATIREMEPETVAVSRVTLFESVLGAGGARYRVIEEYTL